MGRWEVYRKAEELVLPLVKEKLAETGWLQRYDPGMLFVDGPKTDGEKAWGDVYWGSWYVCRAIVSLNTEIVFLDNWSGRFKEEVK